MAKVKKKPPGRPALPARERKTANLTFRVRGDLRERLPKAADAAGRSVSEEVERRVQASFTNEEVLGVFGVDSEVQALSRPITIDLGTLRLQGVSWREHTADVRAGISLIIDAVSASGLPKEVARQWVLETSQYPEQQRRVRSAAYALLQAAGVAPDPNSLDLQVRK
jgi:hypothetical protein